MSGAVGRPAVEPLPKLSPSQHILATSWLVRACCQYGNDWQAFWYCHEKTMCTTYTLLIMGSPEVAML